MREKDGLSSAGPGTHFAPSAPQISAGIIIAKWLIFKTRQLPYLYLIEMARFLFALLLRYRVKIL
jgi:hypothetical protein